MQSTIMEMTRPTEKSVFGVNGRVVAELLWARLEGDFEYDLPKYWACGRYPLLESHPVRFSLSVDPRIPGQGETFLLTNPP